MELRLVSAPACPYVQRAALLLLEKGVPFTRENIDLANKPAWFDAMSPRGRVPVLVADGVPVFESQAICELLEELHPEPALFPRDPLERARDRAWFAYASEDLFLTWYDFVLASGATGARRARELFEERLGRFDRELAGRTWMSGDGTRFGMADVALAPIAQRIDFLERHGMWRLPGGLANVRAWCDRVLARESVARSLPPEAEAALFRRMDGARSFLRKPARVPE